MIAGALLAEVENPLLERLTGLRQGFNTQQTVASDLKAFLWFALGVCVILAILFAWAGRRQKRLLAPMEPRPRRLFGQALRHFGIPLHHRLLIEWLARRSELRHPTAILVSSDLFDSRLVRTAEELPFAPLRRYARGRLAALRRAAFGEAV